MENITIKEHVEGEGITVEELINFLYNCPKDAIVLLNHKVSITDPDGESITYGWCFDTIAEAQCERIKGNRYLNYKSENKIVWLTHQYKN